MGEFLEQKLITQINEVFVGLVYPVEMALFTTQESPTCAAVEMILEEVAALSPLLSLKVYDFQDNQDLARQYQIDCAPAITFLAVDGDQKIDHGIRYLGVPSGNEFTTLINDLMLVSTRNSALKPEVVEYLQNLKTSVHLQVFVTPTCPYCPRAVMSAHQLAFETSMIQAEAVDAWEFQEKVGQFGVSGVPHTVINQGKGNLVGSAGVEDLLAEIRRVVDGVGEGA